MTDAKDYLDFLEQHRLMDDAQKYPLVVEYARSCEAEIARLRGLLERASDFVIAAPWSTERMSLLAAIDAALGRRE